MDIKFRNQLIDDIRGIVKKFIIMPEASSKEKNELKLIDYLRSVDVKEINSQMSVIVSFFTSNVNVYDSKNKERDSNLVQVLNGAIRKCEFAIRKQFPKVKNLKCFLLLDHSIRENIESRPEKSYTVSAENVNNVRGEDCNKGEAFLDRRKQKSSLNSRNKVKLPNVGQVVVILSGKGGVGKSTVALNTARALASMGYNVGLMDADIYGPSITQMLKLSEKNEPKIENNRFIPTYYQGLEVMSAGLFIPESSAMVWRGPMVTKMLKQMLEYCDWGVNFSDEREGDLSKKDFGGKVEVNVFNRVSKKILQAVKSGMGSDPKDHKRGSKEDQQYLEVQKKQQRKLDYLVIDTPPGTGDVHLSLAENYVIDKAILVSTPQRVALSDTKRSLDMIKKLHIPLVGIVENMSYIMQNNGEKLDAFCSINDSPVKGYCEEMDIKLLARIPLSPLFSYSLDKAFSLFDDGFLRTVMMNIERTNDAEFREICTLLRCCFNDIARSIVHFD